MDDKKIIKLKTEQKEKEESDKKQTASFSLHTNPIIKKMLFLNMNNKKDKFSLKDWFR